MPAIPVHAHEPTFEALFCLDGRLRVTADGDVRPGRRRAVPRAPGQVAERRIFPEQAEPADPDRLAAAAAELEIVLI